MRIQSRSCLATLVLAGLALGCEHSVEPTGRIAIRLEQGSAQGANVGSAVAVAPVVKVVNANDQPVPGVRVNFAIASGGGSVSGTSVNTDANGLAAIGSWTLGSVGENQLTATVTGVEPLVIVAVGRCVEGTVIAIDETLAGNLSSTDCRFANGEFTDRYTFTTTVQRAVRFSQASSTINSFLELQGPGNVVAFNNNLPSSNDAGFKVILAPGSYDLNPSSEAAAQSGAYTVAAAAAPESETGCEIVFAVPGVETVQTLASTDCVSEGYRYDAISVYMHAGRTYTITMNSPTFNTYLQLINYASGALVEENDNLGPSNTNARIIYRPTTSAFHIIAAQGATTTALGNYTLIIQ